MSKTATQLLTQQRDAAKVLQEATTIKAEQMYQEGRVDGFDSAINVIKFADDLQKEKFNVLSEKAKKQLWKGLAIGLAIGIVISISSLVLFGVI